MFVTMSIKQCWYKEELESCTGEWPKETLAEVNHLCWPPHCFLALLSLILEDGAHTLQLSLDAAGHPLMCHPFASRASWACLQQQS